MEDIQALKRRYPLELGADNPILRAPSKEISIISPAIQELHDALALLVREYEGVGLAAPQIGHNVRMCAITQRNTSKKKRTLTDEIVMINPVIVGANTKKDIEEEGCLSLPGITGEVARPTTITVKYQRKDGATHILKAHGYNARIIQHEIDHLDGVLFIDKLV